MSDRCVTLFETRSTVLCGPLHHYTSSLVFPRHCVTTYKVTCKHVTPSQTAGAFLHQSGLGGRCQSPPDATHTQENRSFLIPRPAARYAVVLLPWYVYLYFLVPISSTSFPKPTCPFPARVWHACPTGS
ncbi:hypothetical protein E2C01_012269 [Portunus trituberculatus]|uniref:Uncharacterized protein n=1 Tax=Portunus trituberculatus TaxID=210409 RepID=A0A5B7DE33_PORTR|nr:hypothetical protein [Portunus trituberculatus]